ncbi:3D domain-containing protein [Lysinibacillus capsici]|uniref:3D domain-containing protein n=1 Tax=Lysinibacillus capsici TaxID=2115968 RepID=UPI000E1FEBEC|nr:3D domain-containing protein [Lysinibacillus capsici]RDV27760.1 hypothetical protein C7B89_19470 [Lysinibacillus capsici]
MKKLYASAMALLIAVTLFIYLYKPQDHEQLSESPTVRNLEHVEYNGFNAIYTQVLEKKRLQAESERKKKRQQALEEAHRLYHAKIAEEKRTRQEEKRRNELKRKTQEQVSRNDDVQLTQLSMIATHYTSTCNGCSGITATGYDVRQTIYAEGLRVIAVDPRVIPLGSIVRIDYPNGTSFKAICADTGGAIKGHKIDVLVSNINEAYSLGKQTVTVTILKNGKGR